MKNRCFTEIRAKGEHTSAAGSLCVHRSVSAGSVQVFLLTETCSASGMLDMSPVNDSKTNQFENKRTNCKISCQ